MMVRADSSFQSRIIQDVSRPSLIIQQRDDERYPIPADPPVTWENGESGSSLPQVSATQNYDGHRDKYLSPAHGSIELRSTVSETSALAPIATEKSARPKRTILGLRRRVFWSIAGVVTILVIVDAVVGAVIGSSKIGSTSSSTTTTAPMTAQQRGIGAATMNITGSTATNVQVVYQDLDSTDLLYRLVWNDKAGAEQRISSLDPSPQQKTPIAVTTANNTANDGIVTSIFYLSENHDNSSLSDIGQVTLQCSLGVENCTVSVIGKISDGALKGVLHNSGLAAVLLPDSSDIRVYYKNGGHAIRALVGNGTTTDGWDDILIGSQASPQSSISVNFDQKNGNLQVVFVNMSSKLLQEIVYSDAAGVGTTSGKNHLVHLSSLAFGETNNWEQQSV